MGIKGSFWNKTAKAIICYRGRKYRRKLADFEWLRNVMFHNDPNRAIPRLSTMLPESAWYRGYLKERKTEINAFLRQCQATKWVRDFEGYERIFFARSHKQWKKLRNNYDKRAIVRKYDTEC